MKIVSKKSDSSIFCVTDGDVTYGGNPPEDCDVHDIPGWDWSLVDLSGVDKSAPFWVKKCLMWSGSNIVKRIPPLP